MKFASGWRLTELNLHAASSQQDAILEKYAASTLLSG
jgi:hypothetical protein